MSVYNVPFTEQPGPISKPPCVVDLQQFIIFGKPV